MAKRAGLGKGLEALLGDINSPPIQASSQAEPHSVTDNQEKTNILELPIMLLDPNHDQPRKSFDNEKLEELAESILHSGIIQPIIVKQNKERYSIIAGERRWRAARLAGLKTVPVLIRNYSDDQILEVALIENLQRSDLNPVEEAAGIQLLMQEHDLTQEEVGQRLGKSRPAIANALRLLKLPESVLMLLREGTISSGHARCLVALPTAQLQEEIAKEIEHKQLSVRQTEVLCKARLENKKKSSRSSIPTELNDVQSTLQLRLETKVKISGNLNRGKISIEYYSEEQLGRIYEYLKGE